MHPAASMEIMSMIIASLLKGSHEWHCAAGGHNRNGAARVSKRMFGSRAGDLSTDLRRSVIWTCGGENLNVRLLTRAALSLCRTPKSSPKNKKPQRSTTKSVQPTFKSLVSRKGPLHRRGAEDARSNAENGLGGPRARVRGSRLPALLCPSGAQKAISSSRSYL
jgi:hypothetical protein